MSAQHHTPSVQTCPPLLGSHHLVRHGAGKPVASVGIELQPLGFAPFGELVRVYVHTDHTDALSAESLVASLSSHKPLRIGPMEFVTILEHGAKPGEGVRPVPGHTGDLNLHEQLPEKDAESCLTSEAQRQPNLAAAALATLYRTSGLGGTP